MNRKIANSCEWDVHRSDRVLNAFTKPVAVEIAGAHAYRQWHILIRTNMSTRIIVYRKETVDKHPGIFRMPKRDT